MSVLALRLNARFRRVVAKLTFHQFPCELSRCFRILTPTWFHLPKCSRNIHCELTRSAASTLIRVVSRSAPLSLAAAYSLGAGLQIFRPANPLGWQQITSSWRERARAETCVRLSDCLHQVRKSRPFTSDFDPAARVRAASRSAIRATSQPTGASPASIGLTTASDIQRSKQMDTRSETMRSWRRIPSIW